MGCNQSIPVALAGVKAEMNSSTFLPHLPPRTFFLRTIPATGKGSARAETASTGWWQVTTTAAARRGSLRDRNAAGGRVPRGRRIGGRRAKAVQRPSGRRRVLGATGRQNQEERVSARIWRRATNGIVEFY